jgi:hypothetical protein
MNRKDWQPQLTREAVYALIDGERAYQDRRWNDDTTESGGVHSFEEWFTYIEDYVSEAKHILSREPIQTARPKAAAIMRKVAGMAVCAMEHNGAPPRE